MAHTRQSRPDSGLGFQVYETLYCVSSSLGSGCRSTYSAEGVFAHTPRFDHHERYPLRVSGSLLTFECSSTLNLKPQTPGENDGTYSAEGVFAHTPPRDVHLGFRVDFE